VEVVVVGGVEVVKVVVLRCIIGSLIIKKEKEKSILQEGDSLYIYKIPY
jgi:hypothetical protein